MKSFCGQCRFFSRRDMAVGYNPKPKWMEFCAHKNNRVDSYLGEKHGYALKPEKKNKDNNCKDFEER